MGEDRRLTARVGLRRHPFSVNREIFTLSLLRVEMNSKISRDVYRHSHSKNSHDLETQIYTRQSLHELSKGPMLGSINFILLSFYVSMSIKLQTHLIRFSHVAKKKATN